MNAIPNTEDLRYMLTECTMQRKPVLLPFKNPSNGLGFAVKVSPAIGESGPRWTFERVTGNTQNVVWTRETREVAMIQGKLAIDTIYTGESQAQVSTPEQASTHGPVFTSSEVDSATTTLETLPVPTQFGFIEPPNYRQNGATNWFCSFAAPQESALPAPAQFDSKLLGRVVASLTDPKTYLATYGAFAYFLLRQHAQYQMTNAGFAVAVFQIIIKQNGEEMLLPRETFRQVAERIRALMSALDVAAHVGAGEFAVLLCSSDGADALRFARSLYGTLAGQSLLRAGVTAEETVVVGVAACPETCEDPGELLAAAREAKEAAICSSRPYLLFP